MTVAFDRPVGAVADLAELEYVSALHQTQSGRIRTDGSIRDVDIMHFLRSRYGLEVDLETVRCTVLYGLGGDFEGCDSGEDEHVDKGDDADAKAAEEEIDGIDLAEMVAILLIPTLLKSARRDHSGVVDELDDTRRADGTNEELLRSDFSTDQDYVAYHRRRRLLKSLRPDCGLIRDVLSMILRDVTGSAAPKELTPSLVRSILIAYGEEDLARNDELVEDMILAASPGEEGAGAGAPLLLDADAFVRGLTADVLLLNVNDEARISSNYDDVLMAESELSSSSTEAEEGFRDDGAPKEAPRIKGGWKDDPSSEAGDGFRNDGAPEEVPRIEGGRKDDRSSEEKLKPAFSAAAIDYVADQYRSKMLVVCLWTGFVLLYFAYRDYIDKWIAHTKFAAQFDAEVERCSNFYGSGKWWEALRVKDCLDTFWDDYMNSQGIVQDLNCPDVDSRINWGCLIVKSIVKWLYVLGLLALIGLSYIGLGSIGNNVRAKRKWPMIVGILFGTSQSYVLFFTAYNKEDKREDYSVNIPYYSNITNVTGELPVILEFSDRKTSLYEAVVQVMALVISSVAIILQLLLLLGPLLQRCFSASSALASKMFTPGSVQAEAQIKQAAARKINAMVKNAREVHGDSKDADFSVGGDNGSFGQGLVNFSLQENKVESAGGFLWTWKKILSGELYTVEGIWISSRIWAGNLAQFLISLFIIVFGAVLTRQVVEKWREGLENDGLLSIVLGWIGISIDRDEIAAMATSTLDLSVKSFVSMRYGEKGCGDAMDEAIAGFAASNNSFVQTNSEEVCALLEYAATTGVYDASDLIKNVTLFAVDAVNITVDKLSDSIYPTEEVMVKAPLILATAVAFLSVIILSLIYIPSVISTTLKFRSGLIPFMHDKNQNLYRTSMDQVAIVLGSMFWGALYSAGFLGIIFGGVLFLFLWQVTQRHMATITAQLTGLAITITLKLIVVWAFLRATVYVAFYRRKPAQGNIVSLILEIANIGYAIGTALARALQLVLISALYIGRLDMPLLADGVGVGPLVDTYPTIFRKDILSHEAHRHPYLERLGLIYMMKIRYGEKFGNKAGYCFRLIFAVALMPWIRKYRVMARPNLLDDENKEKKMSADSFDNSLMLPRASILHSSVVASSVLPSKRALLAGVESESEVEKLQAENQMLRQALEDANIDVKKAMDLQRLCDGS